ncbi:HIV Tat-specific factor 1 [Savitreella phatthalungensis]
MRAVWVEGLPPDTDEIEVARHFARCGILAQDSEGNDRVKVYSDGALIHFFREESVALSITLLDEVDLRGHRLRVMEAEFKEKPERQSKRARTDMGHLTSRLTDWSEDQGNPCMVILKGMFSLSELEEDKCLRDHIQEDIRLECTRFGVVIKVVIFDLEPNGIAAVIFRDQNAVEACIKVMNGRWFGGRKISATKDDLRHYKRADTSKGKFALIKEEEGGRLSAIGDYLARSETRGSQ